MSFCCVCNGSCNHTGPHSLCEAHGGKPFTGYISTGSGTAVEPIKVFQTDPNYGWTCPKCGSVYAPCVTTCSKCGNYHSQITWQSFPNNTYPVTVNPMSLCTAVCSSPFL